jgi:hypothetical protein
MNLRAFFFATLADSSAALSSGANANDIVVPEGGTNVCRLIFIGRCDRVPRSIHQ